MTQSPKYIINTIRSLISKMEKEKIIQDIEENELESFILEIFDCICISHDFLVTLHIRM